LEAVTEFHDVPAAELVRRVKAREVRVVELAKACLERVEALNTRLNAIVTLNPAFLEEARDLDRRIESGEDPGILCGLPAGIKDVTPVKGLRTTFGSPIHSDYVPAEDAVVVRRLRKAGALILGKTNCPEFAAGANTFNEVFGRTRNPWNLEKSAGGSTGGGAAALATGMIALAEGTDLGGSLRIPASFCGIVGLRPTVGLVPTYPTDWVWDTLQVSGPMARRAEDVALMLQAIAGPSEYSPLSQSIEGRDFPGAVAAGVPPGVRAAYCSDIAGIGVDADIDRVCRDAVSQLTDQGVEVEEIELKLGSGRPAFLALRGLWFVTQMRSRMEHRHRFGPNVGNNVRSGLDVTTSDLANAESVRNEIWLTFREFFERFDYLLTPCMAVTPFAVEQNYPDTVAGKPMQTYIDWIAPTFVLSLTGLPVASVPAGIDQAGMPVGLQILGGQFDEERVLALASVLERINPIGSPRL